MWSFNLPLTDVYLYLSCATVEVTLQTQCPPSSSSTTSSAPYSPLTDLSVSCYSRSNSMENSSAMLWRPTSAQPRIRLSQTLDSSIKLPLPLTPMSARDPLAQGDQPGTNCKWVLLFILQECYFLSLPCDVKACFCAKKCTVNFNW